MLMGELLRHSIRLHPRVVALRDERRQVTFRELGVEVERMAGRLVGLGLRRGDRVAVLARNRIEYICLYLAAAETGMVTVPLNWRLGPGEILHILEHSGAKALLAERPFLRVVDGFRSEIEGLGSFVDLDGGTSTWLSYADLPVASSWPRPQERDDAVQMYTSGTTGAPKGVLLTHKNLVWNTLIWHREMPLQPERSRFLQVTPLFHIGGLTMALCSMAAGATEIMLREFAPDLVARSLQEDQVTHALLVPSMMRWLLSEPSARDRRFPRLERMLYGGSPIPGDLLVEAMERFDCGFVQGYGLTETCAAVTALRPRDHLFASGRPLPRRLSSVGREILCTRVAVVDPAGKPLGPEEVGEIVARGRHITSGYWRMPEVTARTIRDGWFHTGDLGSFDEDGYLYIVDRLKDLILVGGENVAPREVEDVLHLHPAVKEAAVIGIPHQVWGETVLALVVTRGRGGDALARELIRHCRASLALFKCPRKVIFRDHLPRNAAGKVQKARLREPWWRHRKRKV